MSDHGRISIGAGNLQEALTLVVPKASKNRLKPKPTPIIVTFDERVSMLRIEEAKHGAKSHEVPATGVWPFEAQIDGRKLRGLCEKLKPDVIVTIDVDLARLTLSSASFKAVFERIDAGGKPGIKRTNLPKNPRHRGKVEVPPDPTGKRVELDATWDFSARMPVPQHRKPKD